MLKNIINLSEKELTGLLNSEFEIIEKLDMYYFRMNITNAGIFVTKTSTDKVISDIDCITNSMFNNIIKYSELFETIRDQILEIYGECRIGMFYNAFPRIRRIHYNSSTNANAWGKRDIINDFDKRFQGTFILSDLYTSTKALNNEKNFDRLFKSINDSGILLFPRPVILLSKGLDSHYIRKVERTLDRIREAKEKNRKPIYGSLAHLLTNKSIELSAHHTYTGDIRKCESIILKNNRIQCEVPLTTIPEVSEEDKNAKRMYRDIVLASFATEMMKDKNLLEEISNSNDSYIDKVSNLFIRYVNNTDLLSKYMIDYTDLLPPGTENSINQISYDYIDNNTAVTLCKVNPVYENIFRLLLHSLSKKISDNKFSELPDNISNYLNELIIALKYKNYKEIAYEFYKNKN